MKTLDLLITADVDGHPIPGFAPYLRQFPVREAFKFRTSLSSALYTDILSGVVPSSDLTVRVILLTTDAAVTGAIFEDNAPSNDFDLAANQLLIIAGNAVETAVLGNPLLRISVPTGTANLTGIVGYV